VSATNASPWTGDIDVGDGPTRRTVRLGGDSASKAASSTTSGKPVAGARVSWGAKRDFVPDKLGGECQATDAEGVFRIGGLSPGDYEMRAEAEGHVCSNLVAATAPAGAVRLVARGAATSASP